MREQETEAATKIGRVLSQFPPAGTKVDKGAEVTIVGRQAGGGTGEPGEAGKP